MRWKENIFLFFNLLNSIFSVVPVWNFENSVIDLFSSSSNSFTVNGENCRIEKRFKKMKMVPSLMKNIYIMIFIMLKKNMKMLVIILQQFLVFLI